MANTNHARTITSGPQRDKPEGRLRVVGSYDTYPEAEWVVNHLKNLGVPLDTKFILAGDLAAMQQEREHMTYGRAALYGMAIGALVGGFIGTVAGASAWSAPGIAQVSFVALGVVLGMLAGTFIGVFIHWVGQSDREARASLVQAGRYDVTVDEEHADEAERILRETRAS